MQNTAPIWSLWFININPSNKCSAKRPQLFKDQNQTEEHHKKKKYIYIFFIYLKGIYYKRRIFSERLNTQVMFSATIPINYLPRNN